MLNQHYARSRGASSAEPPSLLWTAQAGDIVPDDYALPRVRASAHEAQESRQGTLTVSYSHVNRPSIVPGCAIRALLLQVLCSIRCKSPLFEQVRYVMLHRCFVGFSLDQAIRSATSFTKGRERLVDHLLTTRLLRAIAEQAPRRRLSPKQHFCVGRNLSTPGTGSRRRLALPSSIDHCARAFSVVSTGSASRPGWHFGYDLVRFAALEAG